MLVPHPPHPALAPPFPSTRPHSRACPPRLAHLIQGLQRIDAVGAAVGAGNEQLGLQVGEALLDLGHKVGVVLLDDLLLLRLCSEAQRQGVVVVTVRLTRFGPTPAQQVGAGWPGQTRPSAPPLFRSMCSPAPPPLPSASPAL